ncbi:hypothetical protein HOD20_07795 [archaeon]|jgi:hypothetical protein|nr:hypothetical protein [archaeon]MBT4352411.1 hypothetical protein [archaeon]MBT4648447.1 hypothetical protein [archaeon]MBT6821745.1 hypothetical protein [archaeon]MBT7391225.1 hypothetical protein [archaeon]
MKKKYLKIILIVLILLIITSCNKKDSTKINDENSTIDNSSAINNDFDEPKLNEKDILNLYDDGLDDALMELDLIS